MRFLIRRVNSNLSMKYSGSNAVTIELEILVLGGAVIGLLCGVVGYWWATINLRKAAGGKSVAELAAEKEQYENRGC